MSQLVFIPQAQMMKLHGNLEAFATAARINVLSMAARAGCGHLGGSLSAIDIMACLYLRVMAPEDVFILSKGHAALGLYAVLHGIGKLSDEEILTFRDGKGGLPAHPVIGTPGIECNTGSLGMGISKAKGMILADRLAGVRRRYFVLVGDGEMQEGQCWEALMPHGIRSEPTGITVLIDHNLLQGQTWCDETRPLAWGVASTLISSYWPAVHMHGHRFQGIQAGFAELSERMGSAERGILVTDTDKGKGISFMENDPSWHGRSLTETEYERAAAELLERLGAAEVFNVDHTWPAPLGPDELVTAYGLALLDAAERHPELVVLDADLAKECGLLPFKERYPERFFECGIAEQDMVSIASGMALRGLLPIVHSHAAFLTRRAWDQVHNQTTENSRVIYVGGSAGKLQPNGNGKSHETLIDGTTMALLGIPVFEPHSPAQVATCLERCLATWPGSSYIRLLKVWR